MGSLRQSHIRPVKRVPKRVLRKCAIEYMHLVQAVVDAPSDLHTWLYLYLFMKYVLRQLVGGSGKKIYYNEQADYI